MCCRAVPVVLLTSLVVAGPAAAQSESDNKVYTYVEQMPTMPNGEGQGAIVAAIQERLVYPELARREKVTGRVFVSFVVTTTGKIVDIKVVKGLGAGCDEAAVQAVQQLPTLVPGKQNGRAVAVSFTVPVTFQDSGPATPLANRVYTYVEQMPTLPGQPAQPDKLVEGVLASYGANLNPVQKAVGKNLVLPAEVLDGRSEGIVYASFVVSPSGEVGEAKIVRGLCAACDAAVLAAVHKLPRFVPGQQGGRPVAVLLNLPVTLKSPTHVYSPEELPTRARPAGAGIYDFISRTVHVPAVVASEGLRGRIRVDFIVRPDGRIDAPEVKTHLCASCDAEALRVVRAFPAWTPARDAMGQAVATRQTVEVPMPLPNPNSPFPETERVFTYASPMPTLLDGTRDYAAAISQALQYPEAVRRENISGVVGVDFVVDADGLVRRPRITKGLCVSCDQAVLAALQRLGPFTPGRQNDQAVPVQIQTSINFTPVAAAAKK